MFATLIAFVLFLFFADSTGVPPIAVDIITAIVTIGLAVFLKVGPVPSRVVGIIGAAAGLFGMVGPQVIAIFPADSHVHLILVIVGFALTLISERVQGGASVPK